MPRRYANTDPAHRPHTASAILRWGVTDRLLRRRRARPPGPAAPWVAADDELIHEDSKRPRLTWIDSAFLGTLDGASFLIDPVFTRRVGGVFRRFCPPGVDASRLPGLEAVLISHNHYDHLDATAIPAVGSSVPVVVPEGLGSWMRQRGRSVVELRWWESTRIGRLDITMVPMHWGSFQLTDEPLAEPRERLLSWWSKQVGEDRRRLADLAVGETVVLWGRGHDRAGGFAVAGLGRGSRVPAQGRKRGQSTGRGSCPSGGRKAHGRLIFEYD